VGTIALILVPAALFVAVVAVVLAMRNPAQGGIRATVPGPWLAVTLVLLFLGLFVAPRLLGFTFLLLPFLLVIRPRRRRGQG